MRQFILFNIKEDQYHFLLFKEGKEIGLNYFYKYLYKSTFSYAHGIISDTFRIHSYIQDAFLVLWTSRVQIKDTFHAFNFIRLVVRRNCYNFLKYKEQKKIQIISFDTADIGIITWPNISKEIEEQELRLETDDLLKLIRNAIPYLKADRKTIIKLYSYGFKKRDISSLCGQSYKSVSYKLSRGLRELELISKKLKKIPHYERKEELLFLSHYKISLSQQHFKILELYNVNKLSFKMISEKLNISPFLALYKYQEAIQEARKLNKMRNSSITYLLKKIKDDNISH